MTIFIEDESKVNLAIDYKELAEKAISASAYYVSCPYEIEVNLVLTDNEEIQSLNAETREIDKSTDVLSFPMVEYEKPGEFAHLESQPLCFHPQTGELLIGDIVISKEKVLEQAEAYNHSIEREYTFLIVHSMLHLFGYDHMDEEERIEMEELQTNIMNQLEIYR